MYLKKTPRNPHKNNRKTTLTRKQCLNFTEKQPDKRKSSFLYVPPLQNLVHSHPAVVLARLTTHNPWPKVCFPSGPFASHKAMVSEDLLNGGWLLFKANVGLWAGISPGIFVGMWKPRDASVTRQPPAELSPKHSPVQSRPPSCSPLQQQLSSGDPQIHTLQTPDFNKTRG